MEAPNIKGSGFESYGNKKYQKDLNGLHVWQIDSVQRPLKSVKMRAQAGNIKSAKAVAHERIILVHGKLTSKRDRGTS